MRTLKNLFKQIDYIESANGAFEQHLQKSGKIINCDNVDDFFEKFRVIH